MSASVEEATKPSTLKRLVDLQKGDAHAERVTVTICLGFSILGSEVLHGAVRI